MAKTEMKKPSNAVLPDTPAITNGSGAAAILSAGVGCFVLSLLAILGDKSAFIQASLVFYKPTGPLSGVTTVAIVVWLVTWGILAWSWKAKTVAAGRMIAIAFALLALSLILTFPPVGDLF
ncbi:MAG TPA: hypothetical protein VF283_15560 [Bryobacteraceae bacterium]